VVHPRRGRGRTSDVPTCARASRGIPRECR
jgi:hypothetical protein